MFLILPKSKSQNFLCGFILNLILIWNKSAIASDVGDVLGGVRFVDPHGRSSLWRLNSSRFLVNTNDHRQNCGGFKRHWIKNKGECGICGDPADGPKAHEFGGKFYSGYIAQTFSQNSIIEVAIETFSDLNGYVEFRICDNGGNKSVTQSCLDENVLKIGSTDHFRYRILETGYHVIPLQLPDKLHCKDCLLQLKYKTGYRWGCEGNDCCHGCGKQEEFYGCSDIAVVPETRLKFKPKIDRDIYTKWWCFFQCINEECESDVCLKYSHLRRKRQTALNCKATGIWAGNAAMDDWCRVNCVSYCPDVYCQCSGSSATTTVATTTSTVSPSTPGLLNIYVTPTQASISYGISSFQIRCFVTGLPVATNWFWTKTPINGQFPITLSRTTNSANYMIDQSPTEPHLTIYGITDSDEADYKCHADNGGGLRASTVSRLEVVGGLLTVSVYPTEHTATVGDTTFTLECSVVGQPEAVSWYWIKNPLNGGPPVTIGRGVDDENHFVADLPSAPYLTLRDITKEDAGDYECYAVNIAGTSSSNAKVRIHVKDLVPAVVRVLATTGCRYCYYRNNVTCADWYCSEEFLATLDFSGSITERMNMLADEFCSICGVNDTNCNNYFCLPNRQIVPLTIQARCNLCQTQTSIECPTTEECTAVSVSLQKSESDAVPTKPIQENHLVAQAQQMSDFTCRGVRPMYNSAAMDQWCKTVCLYGFCPQTMCECGYFPQTQSTTLTTTTPTTTTPQLPSVDYYSQNAMNRVLCSICSQHDLYGTCANKYCGLYNQDLDDPTNKHDHVLTYSSSSFCDLGTSEGDIGMQDIYCGSPTAAISTDLKTVLCDVCQTTGNQCIGYCS